VQVLKRVDVVIILTMYVNLTVGSSPFLCISVVDRFVYVDIIKNSFILMTYCIYFDRGLMY
jgi:hypothetical protein